MGNAIVMSLKMEIKRFVWGYCESENKFPLLHSVIIIHTEVKSYIYANPGRYGWMDGAFDDEQSPQQMASTTTEWLVLDVAEYVPVQRWVEWKQLIEILVGCGSVDLRIGLQNNSNDPELGENESRIWRHTPSSIGMWGNKLKLIIHGMKSERFLNPKSLKSGGTVISIGFFFFWVLLAVVCHGNGRFCFIFQQRQRQRRHQDQLILV